MDNKTMENDTEIQFLLENKEMENKNGKQTKMCRFCKKTTLPFYK